MKSEDLEHLGKLLNGGFLLFISKVEQMKENAQRNKVDCGDWFQRRWPTILNDVLHFCHARKEVYEFVDKYSLLLYDSICMLHFDFLCDNENEIEACIEYGEEIHSQTKLIFNRLNVQEQ